MARGIRARADPRFPLARLTAIERADVHAGVRRAHERSTALFGIHVDPLAPAQAISSIR